MMMFWFTYLSVGALVRRRRLMVVDAFVGQLRPRPRVAISGLTSLFAAVALIWLCVSQHRADGGGVGPDLGGAPDPLFLDLSQPPAGACRSVRIPRPRQGLPTSSRRSRRPRRRA